VLEVRLCGKTTSGARALMARGPGPPWGDRSPGRGTAGHGPGFLPLLMFLLLAAASPAASEKNYFRKLALNPQSAGMDSILQSAILARLAIHYQLCLFTAATLKHVI